MAKNEVMKLKELNKSLEILCPSGLDFQLAARKLLKKFSEALYKVIAADSLIYKLYIYIIYNIYI